MATDVESIVKDKEFRDLRSVYLAGPMRGIKDFNFPEFLRVAAVIEQQYNVPVYNPAERDLHAGFDPTKQTLDGFDFAEAWTWDIHRCLDCDAIVLLPGWEDSRGACIEVQVADMAGNQVYLWIDDQPVPVCMGDDTPTEKQVDDASMQSILAEAEDLIAGDRRDSYGPAIDNFVSCCDMFNAMTRRTENPVAPWEFPLMMICNKLCRSITDPAKRDNYTDIAGYIALAFQCRDNEMTRRAGKAEDHA